MGQKPLECPENIKNLGRVFSENDIMATEIDGIVSPKTE
ncbi:MAG: hypothetical protein ACI9YL_002290 [Luteibaculaceae bacterium]|jgi:hypothetical protein